MHPFARKALQAAIGAALAALGGFFALPETAAAPAEFVPAVLQAPSHASLSIPFPLSLDIATSTLPLFGIESTTPARTVSEPHIVVQSSPIPKKEVKVATTAPTTPPVPVIPQVTPQNVISTVEQTLQPTTTPDEPPSVTNTVRAAVVNIICVTKASGPFNSISGSGVLIDSRGVILTNAHVGQFFLLKDYPTPDFVSCVVRTGSPAYPRYTAELLYFPPSWMAKNAYKITQESPTGNGEHDWALLRITGTVNPKDSLPSSFPYLAIATYPPAQGASTILAAYPAGFLGGITVAEALYSASAFATIREVYTFGTDTVDLFSIGGTVVAQKGSSGGAVTDEKGTLTGLIVTATDAPDTASRDLRAIATSYIIRDFANEFGSPLPVFLENDIKAEAHSFALGTAPTLTTELRQALER